jgi:uroporphyrinogen-III synthase
VSADAGLRRPLDGRRILITRPRDQAEPLANVVREQGGEAILFPAIEITDVVDRTRLNGLIDSIDTFDSAIFISPNAARRGMQAVRARRELPPNLQMIAIGMGTARELERQGVVSVIVPPGRFDSETLLTLPELADVANRRIVIFRGEGGRALLGETLAARGASVEYAECYVRGEPTGDVKPLLQAWSSGAIHGVVVTSSEGLRNLHESLGSEGRGYLECTALFVPHERIAATARTLGLNSIIVTPPGDEGIARALTEYFSQCG